MVVKWRDIQVRERRKHLNLLEIARVLLEVLFEYLQELQEIILIIKLYFTVP